MSFADSMRWQNHKLTTFLLAWLLAGLSCAVADVYLNANNYTFQALPDMAADFGPRLPEQGIQGLLLLADPEDACTTLTFHDFDHPWVALVSRAQFSKVPDCTFDVKVRNAEAAGAKAAIVYDDIYESLIIMARPEGHPDPGIPSVFVTENSGTFMKRLLKTGPTYVYILQPARSPLMSLVVSVMLGMVAITVMISAFYAIRSWARWPGRLRRMVGPSGTVYTVLPGMGDDGLSPDVLRSLPVIVHHAPDGREGRGKEPAGSPASSDGGSPPGRHGGATRKLCVVCLEDYCDGDKLRVLPCQHRYHVGCIDQWLYGRRTCPVCKYDASRPPPGGRRPPQQYVPRPPPANRGAEGSGLGEPLLSGRPAGRRRWRIRFPRLRWHQGDRPQEEQLRVDEGPQLRSIRVHGGEPSNAPAGEQRQTLQPQQPTGPLPSHTPAAEQHHAPQPTQPASAMQLPAELAEAYPHASQPDVSSEVQQSAQPDDVSLA